jgi:uncharacterized protein
MLTNNPHYQSLREAIEQMPVIECHDHNAGLSKTTDIFRFILAAYYDDDLVSAAGPKTKEIIHDEKRSLEERWEAFKPVFEATRHTGYGLIMRYGAEYAFGSGEISLDNLRQWAERVPDYSTEEAFYKVLDEARVKAHISDNWVPFKAILDGSHKPLARQYVTISLPGFHHIKSHTEIMWKADPIGATVTSLDEYLELCRFTFEKRKAAGAVCFKDQSAYFRSLSYGFPSKDEAERLFNKILYEPRTNLEWGVEANPLSDYLMHAFMRMAREMELPVQIHTGHMAGSYQDVSRSNAALLRPLLELHKKTRFDLFHANWPYDGDILFLVKNYPNVHLDFCWTHNIDPLYAKNLMMRTITSVPANKIFACGSDVAGHFPHQTFAHVRLARDIIAAALSELIHWGYLDCPAAEKIAYGWLYENPKSFYNLPLG